MISMSDNDSVNFEELLEEKIVVYLKGGTRLEGNLKKYDDYMNLLLENAEEYTQKDELVNDLDRVVVKGGNIRGVSNYTDSIS